MLIKFPKDDKYFSWTRHIKNKMIFYALSESKIRSVLKSPNRKEEGIALNTTAVMKRNDRGKKKEEIWVMYQLASQTQINADQNADKRRLNISDDPRSNLRESAKRKLISAWRYPGVSRPGKEIPIPPDILAELDRIV